MLGVINRLTHGFVAVPVILACEARSVFSLLNSHGAMRADELRDATGANEGHLHVALRMLEALNWITREDGQFSVTGYARERRFIPAGIADLYHTPITSVLNAATSDTPIREWLRLSSKRWNGASSFTADLIDGPVLIPLLLALSEKEAAESLLQAPKNALQRDIAALFLFRGWAEGTEHGCDLSDAGRFLLDRICIASVAASYRPMLGRMKDVLFGDCGAVFARDAEGFEQHIDRTLNVLGSGFQHQQYFSDICEIILDAFGQEPLDQQPKYIMDTGCGDGSLLRSAYEAIMARSPRGKALDRYPLTLIGVDYNEHALKAAAHTLADIPHLLLQGDIGDPDRILSKLRLRGIEAHEAILHIRSFLDHECKPGQSGERTEMPLVASDAISVDQNGSLIPPEVTTTNLVMHFERWQKAIGPHGILILEVHNVDPATAYRFRDECEGIHFDAIHGFSGQRLVEPDVFLSAAANAGLFPRPYKSRRYPVRASFTRITAHHFQKRPYRIRLAVAADLPALLELEQACWTQNLRTPEAMLRQRIDAYPHSPLVVEWEQRIVAVVYMQPVVSTQILYAAKWERLRALHDDRGRTLHLISLNVLPEMRKHGLADDLLYYVLTWASCRNNIEQVAGISRCGDYATKGNGISLSNYISLRDAHGELVDSILRFHEAHGARIIGLLPDYRQSDADNAGHGVVIEYPIRDGGLRHVGAANASPRRSGAAGLDPKPQVAVEEIVRSVLGQSGVTICVSQPFMEMGFDSMQLLELRAHLSEKFGMPLDATFLFRHQTIAAVASAIQSAQAAGTAPVYVGTPSASRAQVPFRKDGVAVVGIACRFPGGDRRGFWRLLREGGSGVREIPEGRWTQLRGMGQDGRNEKFGGYLDRIDTFDARFFRISPAEAELLDPQQRLLLELTWELFEDSGHRVSSFSKTATGVWIGAAVFEYRDLLIQSGIPVSAHWATGTLGSLLSNRLSYFFDLSGPSVTIDTACSSSLVALDAAVRAVRHGLCEQAIAGGVNLICSGINTASFSDAGILSPKGLCQAFDAGADGYVRGEGAGLILLKPLSRALADGDQIYGVIAGTAVNHGGQASSLTAPNPRAQCDLIKSAFREANVLPVSVSYVEAHGTGTSLGDPIEIAGLKDAFIELALESGGRPPSESYCGIGSVKTNIGHLEAAAGIAGVIKVLLSMRYGMLPGNLNFHHLNPHIELSGSPFHIVSNTRPWPGRAGGRPRRASVSSFGFGGANAIAVLEEFLAPDADIEKTRPELIVLSSRSEKQLREVVAAMLAFLVDIAAGKEPAPRIEDLAWTLQDGREEMPERLAFTAGTLDELRAMLRGFLEKMDLAGLHRGRVDAALPDAPIVGGHEEHASIKTLVEQGRLDQLARHWTIGASIDWRKLHIDRLPHRISLPTYPFARERYWVPDSAAKPAAMDEAPTGVAQLHPLLHRNTSDLWGQRFTSDEPDAEPGSLPQSQPGLLKTAGQGSMAGEMADEGLFIQLQGGRAAIDALRPCAEISAPIPEGVDAGSHDRILERVLWVLLCGMGLDKAGASSFDEIKTRLGIADLYHRWLAASLTMLMRQGWLRMQDGLYTVAPEAPFNAEAVWREWEADLEQWWHDPDMGALVRLEMETIRSLPDILTGRTRATDVLFPDGSMTLVQGIYKDNTVADYFNDGVAALTEAFVKARLAQDTDVRIRILEVGAGTGGTSAGVFARLKPYQQHIAKYCYTDLSQAFLTHAQQTFGDEAPYLQTRILDIEQPLAAQGLQLGRYDMVIATNVVHATRNIRQSLRNVKAALCRYGLLVLNELNAGSLSMHITFGLLEGWWLFEDAALRIPGCPLLAPQTWVRLLEEEGFGRILLPLAAARHLGQQIFVAESDGMVRRQFKPQGKTKPPAFIRKAPARIMTASSRAASRDDLEKNAEHYLKKLLSSALKLSMEQIDAGEPLENYGIDSILMLQLTGELEKAFGSLSKTLFFEYQDLRSLTDYFLKAHRERVEQLVASIATYP